MGTARLLCAGSGPRGQIFTAPGQTFLPALDCRSPTSTKRSTDVKRRGAQGEESQGTREVLHVTAGPSQEGPGLTGGTTAWGSDGPPPAFSSSPRNKDTGFTVHVELRDQPGKFSPTSRQDALTIKAFSSFENSGPFGPGV